jgi:hypothetical protein
MSEASEKWLAESFAWLDEQQGRQDAVDEAAWLRFREKLLGPFDF